MVKYQGPLGLSVLVDLQWKSTFCLNLRHTEIITHRRNDLFKNDCPKFTTIEADFWLIEPFQRLKSHTECIS